MAPLIHVDPRAFDLEVGLVYATDANFTGRPVYGADADCWLHGDAEAPLRRAVELARVQGLRLRLLDAFRPAEVQWRLWAHTPDPDFLADPRIGSHHSRGTALDLDLIRADSGQALDMGTGFDAFTPASHHGSLEVGAEAQRNRHLLLGIMLSAGWEMNPFEWWHYQLPSSGRYPLLSDSVLGRRRMMA